MKIYSWNMLFRNRQLDRAFTFITETDFDIFCLQEVPEKFLGRLHALPYSIAFHTDAERSFKKGVVRNFNVILSKYPIRTQGEISFPDYWPVTPLRSRLFIYLMRPFHFAKTFNRGCLYADVVVQGELLRVFNLHLILAKPAWRLKEFELAMAERDPTLSTIVCGDLNILEKPHITLLNWLMGSPIRDAALYTRERTHIEKRFVEHSLTNPLRGKSTHPFSRSQLDHILVSHHLSVQDASVSAERYGSDHNPIWAIVSLLGTT